MPIDYRRDPREGEAPELERYDPARPLGRELTPEETSRYLAEMFRRIVQAKDDAEDEATGAALAARFEVKE